MQITIIAIYCCSILFQLVAAGYSLWLIRLTGLRFSWILISTALLLMCIRRIIPLLNYLHVPNYPVDIPNELIGFVVSSLLFVGVIGIGKIFQDRKAAESKIQSLLDEKSLILREVHHRIKNNMYTISTLLSLQGKTLKDTSAVQVLKEASNRIESMMFLYEKLYQSDSYSQVEVRNYIPGLVTRILENFPCFQKISVKYNLDSFCLDPQKVTPLGIVLNELLTNIMKYAFADRGEGLITVSAILKEQKVVFSVRDNGAGIPESVSFEKSSGFGLMLVGLLAQQLDGSIRIERRGGTEVILEFNR